MQVGSQSAWQCIEFSTQHRYEPWSTAGRKRLPVAILRGQTGCRPRIACVEVLQRSTAVIQYRIGRHVTWPLTSNTPSAYDVCSDDMFTEQSVHHPLPFRSLVSLEKYNSSTVACEIDAWYHFNGSNPRGQRFEGYIDACGSDVNTFRYVTQMTSSSRHDDVVTSQETHRCLATFTERSSYTTEFTYIITTAGPLSNPSGPPHFFCWLLEKSPLLENPRLYLTYAADCHGNVREAILYQSYTGYIAQFDLVSSETEYDWIRNCSSRQQMPVITPGLQRLTTLGLATPGIRSTSANTLESILSTTAMVQSKSSAHTLLTNTAAVTGVALMINLIHGNF